MKIVADRHIPYIEGVLEPYGEVVYLRGEQIGAAEVAGADALIVRTRTKCDAALLEGSRVKFIATATIGADHIDTDYCVRRGIEVAVAAGSNAGGVLQWIAAALAMLSEREGWRPCQKTLGIVGVGIVGSLVEDYARRWGFEVLCSDPPREMAEELGRNEGFVSLDEIAARCDMVTFHTPLTRSGEFPTLGLAGERFFSVARQGITVINSARGGVVDENALINSILGGCADCCIDTWGGEPNIDRRLLKIAIVATPHIAGYSAQGKANASSASVRALARKFGLPGSLSEWYPPEVIPVSRRPVEWDDMCDTIRRYCDLTGETARLRNDPRKFESFRENYAYREEYF
jgi:erythronate-4-phosphate dehydrogenase